MQILYAVIDDLYSYTVGSVIKFCTRDVRVHKAFFLTPSEVETKSAHIVEEESKTLEEDAMTSDTPITFHAIDAILKDRAHNDSIARSVMYVGSARAPLFLHPTKEFDAVTHELRYGDMAMVLEEKGRFARVSVNGHDGWTLRDDLLDRAAYVYPELHVGVANEADDPNTLRLRAVIGDIFHGGEAEFSLQAGEYVYYKLMRKGLTIVWPEVRPRTPGRWHILLKGVLGVSIGVMPKVGSVMEYTQLDEIGHLAYVEAVFPDQSIMISEVNYPDQGIYSERTLTKEEWTTFNPVFLQIA